MLTKWEYNNLIIPKATIYLKTVLCKSILVTYNPHLHYDLESGKLGRDHLIALILYADFANLAKICIHIQTNSVCSCSMLYVHVRFRVLLRIPYRMLL